VYDSTGAKVRTLNGPGEAGINRVVWQYDYQEPVRLQPRPGEQAQPEEENPFRRAFGPPAVPGTYKLEVTANGKTESQTIEVLADPRVKVPMENFVAQTKVALELRDEISALNTALNRVANMRMQIQTAQRFLMASGEDGQPGVANAAYQPVLERARALDRKLHGFQEKLINLDVQPGSDDDIHYLARFQSRLQRLMFSVAGGYGQPPNELVQEEMANARKELDGYLAQFNEIVKTDVPDFNKLAFEKGANTLFAGGPVELKSGAVQAGGGGDEQ
jgi:hypothetical protein